MSTLTYYVRILGRGRGSEILKQFKQKEFSLWRFCNKGGKLTCLINKIIMEAAYPDSLKYAVIKPLHKKGDVNSINNYRPIALLPIINKIIEKIISNRMQEFLMTKGINDAE